MGNLVEVARFIDPEEAYVANSLLNARGVNTIIHNDHHLTMAPHLRIGLGGYGVLCPRSQYEIARESLELRAEREVDDDFEALGGAEDSSPLRKRNWFWLPVAAFYVMPFLPRYRSAWELVLQFVMILLLLTLPLFFAGRSLFAILQRFL